MCVSKRKSSVSGQEEEKRKCVCACVCERRESSSEEGKAHQSCVLCVRPCVCWRLWQINSSQRASERALIRRLAAWLTDPCIHIIGLKSLTRRRYNSGKIWDKKSRSMEKEMWLWTRTGEREIILKKRKGEKSWHTFSGSARCSGGEEVDFKAVTGQYRGRRKRRSRCQIRASPMISKSQDTLQSHCQGCGGGWNLPKFSLHTCSPKPDRNLPPVRPSDCRESHEDSRESCKTNTTTPF